MNDKIDIETYYKFLYLISIIKDIVERKPIITEEGMEKIETAYLTYLEDIIEKFSLPRKAKNKIFEKIEQPKEMIILDYIFIVRKFIARDYKTNILEKIRERLIDILIIPDQCIPEELIGKSKREKIDYFTNYEISNFF